MADLKLLTERVVEKEKQAIREEIEDARKNAEDEIQAARAKAESEKLAQKEAIDEELQQDYTIRKNTVTIQKRNQTLEHKQTVLAKVIDDVKAQLKQVDESTFQSFLAGVLKQFENQGQVNLVLGEESASLVSQEWVEQQQIPGLEAKVQEDTVKQEAGVLVQKDGVEYNFLFSELVDDMRSELLPTISNELFN
jgi:V/A-type H+-transporting ATPase subunit E